MGGYLLMSGKERIRKVMLEGVIEGRLSIREASERLSVSYRQGKRICQRYRREGDEGLLHKGRGHSSNRAKPPRLREKVVARYRERYAGFGPTLAAEKLSGEGLPIDHETLRRWLIGGGLWTRRARKVRHRTYRERRKRFGELVQLDGSLHRWFGRQVPPSCLMDMVDDATGTTGSWMAPCESTAAAMRALRQWVERYGIPLALYTDRHTIYETDREPTLEEALAGQEPLTAFGQSCRKLGIRILTAHSPQAKGRVERKHGVYQDRFAKELLLVGVTTVEGANEVLAGGFVEELNRRFAVPPANPVDAHRPVPKDLDLDGVFCFEESRVVQNDFTVRHKNRWYQITKQNRGLPKPKSRVVVRTLLDGSVELWCKQRQLACVPLEEKPAKPSSRTAPKATVQKRTPSPPVHHPWRTPWTQENAVQWRKMREAQRGHF